MEYEIQFSQRDEVPTAVVRQEVPVTEISAFLGGVFGEVGGGDDLLMPLGKVVFTLDGERVADLGHGEFFLLERMGPLPLAPGR